MSDATIIETARILLHPLSEAEARRIVEGYRGPGDRWAEGYPGDFRPRGRRPREPRLWGSPQGEALGGG